MTRASWRVLPTPADIGEAAATLILERVDAADAAGRRCLLGLPTGRTPKPLYAALTERFRREPRSLAHVTLVMMDEYVTEGGGDPAYTALDGGPSCRRFVSQVIMAPWRDALGAANALPTVWFPNPRDPAAYDGEISEAGGIDLFLLASGASDGHVAFNGPGSAADSRTRVVALAEQTRRDNLVTFPHLGSLDAVPRLGVTAGIATILGARSLVMCAWGPDKQLTVQRMANASRYDPNWPATLVHEHADSLILVDEAAGQSSVQA